MTAKQKELVEQFDASFAALWENDRQKWMGRIKTNPNKCERVLAEAMNADREGRIKTDIARFSEDTWKKFK